MNVINMHGGESPITTESIEAGAIGAPQKTADRPLDKVQKIVDATPPIDLLAMAEKMFDLPLLDDKGNVRRQSQNELIVMTIILFDEAIAKAGLGACIINGIVHLYDGTHWRPITDPEFLSLIGNYAVNLGCPEVGFTIFSTREKLVKQFYSVHEGKSYHRPHQSCLINLLNGTLEITPKAEKLRDFRKQDMLTHQLPFEYDPDAKCPLFDKYLERVLPDKERQRILAEFIGWIFLRDLKLEKVLVLYGDGHNGKSVFFDVSNALLGQTNITNFGLSSLSKMENRPVLGTALLNFGSEINERCDADLLKKLASGEPVEARQLYKDPFVLRDYARLAFNSNVLPRNTEHTHGFYRRFLIVEFEETISQDEKDPDLARKIIESELPGVFNWVIEGVRRLRHQRKFSPCAASEAALASYQEESDTTALFLEECGWKSCPDNRVEKKDLYAYYREYCRDSGHMPLNKNNFGNRLLRTHQIGDCKSGNSRFWKLTQESPH